MADPNVPRSAHLAPLRTVTETFEQVEQGWRTAEIDALGNATRTTYNELGEPIRLEDPDGGVVILRYDANGRLTDRLQEIRDRGLPNGVTALPNRDSREHFEYERDDLPKTRIVDADGLALKWTIAYDGNGNVTLETTPRVHSSTFPDPFAQISHEYDEYNNRTATVEGVGSPMSFRTEFGYDDNGELQVSIYTATGRLTSFSRDGWSRLVAIEDTLGTLDLNWLDEVGNVTRRRIRGTLDGDPTHTGTLQEWFWYYDDADRRIAARARTFLHRPATSGPPTEESIGSGATITTWWHDAAGTEVRHLEPTGLQIDTVPDGHGLRKTASDNQGSSAEFVYDARNLPISATQTDSVGSLATTLGFTAAGRQNEELRGGDVICRTWYDTRGLPRVEEDGVGNRRIIRYDNAARAIDEDSLMYVEGARTPAGGGSNALQSTLTQKTEYYADGRVRRLEDSRGNTAARFEYDPTGRISKRTLPEDAFRMPGGGTVDHNQGDEEYVYSYRADGLLDTITDPDGRVITHAWDTAGRCTGMSVAAAPGSTPRIDGTTQISWTLDGLGRPVATTDDNGPGAGSSTVERTYTSLGLVATERQSEDLGGATVTRDVSAGHLSDGRQSLLSYPGNGPRVRAIPDIHGNTDFVVENVSGTTLVNHVHQQSYLSYLTFANGIRYGYGYNAKKQVAEIRSFTGTDFNDLSASISAHRYVYDARQLVVRDLDLKTDRFA